MIRVENFLQIIFRFFFYEEHLEIFWKCSPYPKNFFSTQNLRPAVLFFPKQQYLAILFWFWHKLTISHLTNIKLIALITYCLFDFLQWCPTFHSFLGEFAPCGLSSLRLRVNNLLPNPLPPYFCRRFCTESQDHRIS